MVALQREAWRNEIQVLVLVLVAAAAAVVAVVAAVVVAAVAVAAVLVVLVAAVVAIVLLRAGLTGASAVPRERERRGGERCLPAWRSILMKRGARSND